MKVSKNDTQGIAGLNAVEKVINNNFGWIFRNQPILDVGLDATIETISEGETDNGQFAVQIKSGYSWFKEKTDTGIIFRCNFEHLDYWLNNLLPVFIFIHHPDGIIYWQIINEKNIIRLEKLWKIEIPFTNTLSLDNKEVIHSLCHFKGSSKDYSELSVRDLSHGFSKRYALDILLNNKLSNGEIINLLISLTKTQKKREYYRSDIVKQLWENTSATVVWIFVYMSYEEHKQNNWICRSQWISEELDSKYAPQKIGGTEIDKNLFFEWSNIYNSLSEIYSNPMTKEKYLPESKKILELSDNCLEKVSELFTKYKKKMINESSFSKGLNKLTGNIEKLNELILRIDNPVLECYDFHQIFLIYIAAIDNIRIVFIDQQKGENTINNRDWLMNDYIKIARKNRLKLGFELEKLN